MMKRLFTYSLIFLLGLAGSGCADLLDTTTYGQQTSETFYKTDSQIGEALTGAYLQLRVKWNEYILDHCLIGDVTTDDALKGGGSEGDMAEMYDMEQFLTQPTNAEVARRWRLLYGLVNRCNDVIYYGPSAQGDKDLIGRYINEAKALRGFGYYFLVTSFGDVPLLTEPATPDEVIATPRAPQEEVWQRVIQDLTDAAEGLPEKGDYPDSDQYRVTRGMALTMLAKAYMFRYDYPNAEKALSEIVGSQKYDLLPQYGWNWFRDYENSIESVFEIPNQMYDKNVGTGTNVPHFFTTRAAVSGYGGYGFHCPSQDLWDAYDPDDPRLTYVFTHTGDRYAGDAQAQDNALSPSGYHDYKYTVPAVDKVGWDVWLIPYNVRFLRYADVLLLYAEALNENGKSGEALQYLNRVRKRARETDPVDPRRDIQVYIPPTTANTLPDIVTTNKDELRQIIWDERRRELAMEGWRREDLIRQKRYGEVMKAYAAKYNTTKGARFEENRDYLLPIPQAEIDRTNNIVTQNPNY